MLEVCVYSYVSYSQSLESTKNFCLHTSNQYQFQYKYNIHIIYKYKIYTYLIDKTWNEEWTVKQQYNKLLPLFQAHAENACSKTLSCGHLCGGIKDEKACLPCLHRCRSDDQELLKQDSDDMCMICFTEALSAAPAVLVCISTAVRFMYGLH